MSLPISESKIKKLLVTGNWMIRVSQDGVGYGNFMWSPVGQWTKCPKWTPKPTCNSGGLFGQNSKAFGYCPQGTRIELCETKGIQVVVANNKIKVPEARIIAIDWDIPLIFFQWSSLDLSGCTGLTSLPDGLKVGGYLDLRGCTGLTSLPDGLKVGGYLDLPTHLTK